MGPDEGEEKMDMLACELKRDIDIPIYEQLYRYIKNEIIAGRIDYGVKLPSKRKLADYLKISLNTVETAYEQLIAEGYIKSVPRKGYFVLAYEELDILNLDHEIVHFDEDEKVQIQYNFHPSWIDTENFPFAKWRKYAKEIIGEEHQTLLLHGDAQGEYSLRCEIAHYLYQSRGVTCSPEQIIIGAGIEALLLMLIQLFEKETVYGVEDPGYHVISKILKNFPNEVKPITVDSEGIQVKVIERLKPDVVYVTPSHHFPYGSVLSVNRRIQLLKWAQEKKNRFIIEDDYDSEFRYSGTPIPSLQSMDQAGKVIYLGTFSKSLMPSIRMSYMVLPNQLLKLYKRKLSFYHCTVPRLNQAILTQFMQAGDFERHLNRMRKIYRRKLEKTLEILRPYKKEIKVIEAHSGFHIVLMVQNGMEEKELVERALKEKVKVYPLSYYLLEEKAEAPPKIVFGFAGVPEEQLEEGIRLLLRSWRISD